MRTEVEVKDRLKALLVQELDRRVGEASKRLPRLCVYNYRHPLDDRKTVDGEPNDSYNRITLASGEPVGRTIGLCMYGQESIETWKGTICEDEIDAKRCPLFTPLKSKDDILQELHQQLGTPGWVEQNLSGVAELLWVLGEVQVPSLPWWKVLWYRWVLRIHIERPMRATNTIDLLPAPGGRDEGVGP